MVCCKAKVTHVEHSVVEKIPIPEPPSHMRTGHSGQAGRDGSTYLLTMIDLSIRWTEIITLGGIDH